MKGTIWGCGSYLEPVALACTEVTGGLGSQKPTENELGLWELALC